MAKDPLQYHEATEAEYAVLKSVRDRWHDSLHGYNIGLFFRNWPQTIDGRQAAATANKANALFQHLTDFDGWIEVWEDCWYPETEEYREYLLDHEMAHFTLDKHGEFSVIGHDVQEHEVVALRHDPAISALGRLTSRLATGEK